MLLLSTRLFLIVSPSFVQAYEEKNKISAPEVAEIYKMNHRALMPSLRRLTQVGILKSQVGGSQPGFILARPPEEISMYEIITALEGESYVSHCRDIIDDVECRILDCNDCRVYNIINRALLSSFNNLKKITLNEHCKPNI